MAKRALPRTVLVGLAFATVFVALLGVPEKAVQYWYLFYSPVLLAAVSFGLPGALAGSVLAVLGVIFFYRVTSAFYAYSGDILDRLAQVTQLPREELLPLLSRWAGVPINELPMRLAQVGSILAVDLAAELEKAAAGTTLMVVGSCLVGWLVDENRRKEQALMRQAVTDGLTGLLNYRGFQQRLEQEVKRTLRYGHPFALLMADLDDFKPFNDAHGHLAGDAALKEVASLLTAGVRSIDVVSRYGGEEFALILLEASASEALAAAERLREAMQAQAFLGRGGRRVPMTISIGVAFCPQDASQPAGLVAATDEALYRAKSLGKNRVCAYRDRPEAQTPQPPAGPTVIQ